MRSPSTVHPEALLQRATHTSSRRPAVQDPAHSFWHISSRAVLWNEHCSFVTSWQHEIFFIKTLNSLADSIPSSISMRGLSTLRCRPRLVGTALANVFAAALAATTRSTASEAQAPDIATVPKFKLHQRFRQEKATKVDNIHYTSTLNVRQTQTAILCDSFQILHCNLLRVPHD